MPSPETTTENTFNAFDLNKLMITGTDGDNTTSIDPEGILQYLNTLGEISIGLSEIDGITNSEQIKGVIQYIRGNLEKVALQFMISELSLQARRIADSISDKTSSEKLTVQKRLTEDPKKPATDSQKALVSLEELLVQEKLHEEKITEDSERQRFEKIVRKVLNKIIEFLKKVSETTPIGVGFTFEEPYLNVGNKIQEGAFRHDIKYILETQEEKGKEEYESQYENERHFLLKMCIGGNELGYMDFVFDGEVISPKTQLICKNIKEVFDTFLNTGLNNILMDRIQEKQEIIRSKFSLLDWRIIMEEYMKILKQIGFNATLICRRFGPETEGSCEITSAYAKDFDEKHAIPSLRGIINDRAMSSGNEILELKILPNDSENSVLMGALLFKSDDEKKTQFLAHFAKTIEEVIKRREELRESIIHNTTRKTANLQIDGKLEKLGKHEFVIMIGDMNGYSAWSERLEKDANAGKFKEALKDRLDDHKILATIMGEFNDEVSIMINTETDGTLDDFIGDEVIVYFGPPFDTLGRDTKKRNDSERDIAEHINDALELTEKIQVIFDKIITRFEQKYGINLGAHPVFSFGIKCVKDYVGIYGDLKKKYSKIKLTDIGTGINRTARIQSAAKNGATLVGYETWEKYLKGGQSAFIQVGPKYYFQGKNLQDPILVVQVERKDKIESQKIAQKLAVQEKISKRGELRKASQEERVIFWDEKNCQEMPDGDYICPSGNLSDKGTVLNFTLYLDNDRVGFPVEIPRDKISEILCVIPDDEEQRMAEQGERMGVQTDIILRKIGKRFYKTTYKTLENVQCENLNRIIDTTTNQFIDDEDKKRKKYLNFDQLIPGVYKIQTNGKHILYPDGDLMLKLERGDRKIYVLVQARELNLLRHDTEKIPKSGIVEYAEGFLNFRPET